MSATVASVSTALKERNHEKSNQDVFGVGSTWHSGGSLCRFRGLPDRRQEYGLYRQNAVRNGAAIVRIQVPEWAYYLGDTVRTAVSCETSSAITALAQSLGIKQFHRYDKIELSTGDDEDVIFMEFVVDISNPIGYWATGDMPARSMG